MGSQTNYLIEAQKAYGIVHSDAPAENRSLALEEAKVAALIHIAQQLSLIKDKTGLR
jgi:hypothetical protein